MTTEVRRAYTPERKAEAVEQVRAGRSFDDVAAAFDVSEAVVRTWWLQAEASFNGAPRALAAPMPAPVAAKAAPVAPPARHCSACGRGPALAVSLRSVTGLVIAFRMGRVTGTFCRDCGTSLARRSLNRTLLAGWWGLFAGVANVYAVVVDFVALGRLRRLPPPSGEVSPHGQPLALGNPMVRRAGVYVGALVVLCWLVAGLSFAGFQSPASRFAGKCIAFTPDRIVAQPNCAAVHDGKVVAVAGTRTACPPETDATLRLKSESDKQLCIDLDR